MKPWICPRCGLPHFGLPCEGLITAGYPICPRCHLPHPWGFPCPAGDPEDVMRGASIGKPVEEVEYDGQPEKIELPEPTPIPQPAPAPEPEREPVPA